MLRKASPACARSLAGLLALLWIAAGASVARATNPASRPILFVPGFCGSSADFVPLMDALNAQLSAVYYPNASVYSVEFNSRSGQTAFASLPGGAAVAQSAIPSNARFFTMQFYDPVSETANPANVAAVSILNKAYEIEQAIVQITAITHVKDVIVLAHSLGGLNARAYIEGMASAGACYDYQAKKANYALNTCDPGAGGAAYGGDVGNLITLDSPHAGTPIDTLNLAPYTASLGACFASASVNRAEMNPKRLGGPGLIEALNYSGAAIDGVKPAMNTAPIEAIEDYFSNVTNPWDNLNGNLAGYSDDIVLQASQSIAGNLPAAQTKARIVDLPLGYAGSNAGIANTDACWVTVPYLGTQVTQPMLHSIGCAGAQPATLNAIAAAIAANETGILTTINVKATFNGKPWSGAVSLRLAGPGGTTKVAKVPSVFDDLALGTYAMSYISGGPSGAGVPKVSASPSGTLKRGQWAATYTVAFTAKTPQATTGEAASVTASGAALKGLVSPEGQPGPAFFEWSTKATLQSPVIACKSGALKNCPAIGASAAAQAVTAKITTAPSGTKIYYRVGFYGTNTRTYIYGKIASFTTMKK